MHPLKSDPQGWLRTQSGGWRFDLAPGVGCIQRYGFSHGSGGNRAWKVAKLLRVDGRRLGSALGLLFVAVSLLANRPERTASIFFMVNRSAIALLYPLIASLVMLIPSGVPTVQAVAAILGGAVGLAGSIGNALRVRRSSGLPEPSEQPIRSSSCVGFGLLFRQWIRPAGRSWHRDLRCGLGILPDDPVRHPEHPGPPIRAAENRPRIAARHRASRRPSRILGYVPT